MDYEYSYIAEAHQFTMASPLLFVTGDAAAVPSDYKFDYAICLTNTWGTMSDKLGVLREMRRLSTVPETRLLSVYSEASINSRREWYSRLGHVVLEESDEYLMAESGFVSEHFSEARLRRLVGDCIIQPLTDIATLSLSELFVNSGLK